MKDNTIPLELNTGEGANRFKYQTFKTRVERIKVDVVRRSRLIDDEPDQHGSFFYEALESWKDLNMTTHFKGFAREITPLVKSLPSIIYHKDKIVDILEKHIKVKESLALDGILDLVTKLAKDLEGEFYPYYARLMKTIVPLVYHRDIVLLESVFNCIAYLFKFLSRQILPDLDVTFHILEKMLGEDNQAKPYVRHFTAEAFAFLMRKARGDDLNKIVKCILDSLRSNPSKEYEEGLAMLFFECIKQVDHQIHSRGEAIYKELLIQSFNEDVSVDNLDESPVIILLSKTTLLVLHHALRQHFTPIINMLLKEMDKQIKAKKLDEKLISIQLTILSMIVTVRKASRVQDFKPIVAYVQDISKTIFTAPVDTYSSYTYRELLRSITGILCNSSIESVVGTSRVILDLIVGFNNVDLIYGFFLSLAKLEWSNFTQICLPYILRYTSNNFQLHPNETLLLLSELTASDSLVPSGGSLSSSLTADGLLRFPDSKKKTSMAQGILDILGSSYDWEKERDLLNSTDMSDENSNISAIAVLGSALYILPRIQVSVSSVSPVLLSLFDSLLTYLKQSEQENDVIDAPFVLAHKNFVLESLLGLVLESLASTAAHNTAVFDEMKKMHSKLIDNVLVSFARNEVVLSGLYRYLDLLRSDIKNNDKFTLDTLQSIYPVLKGNLSSQKRNCRLNTLKILVLFDQPTMKQDADHKVDEPCIIARLSLDMEEIDPSFKEYRDKVKVIQKLNIIISSKRIPDMFTDFVPLLCLGTLTVNLRPLWADAKKCLVTFSQVNKDLYWNTIFGELSKYKDETSLVWDGFSRAVMDKLAQPEEPEIGNATKTGKISFECPTLSKFTFVENKAWVDMKEEKAQSLSIMFVQMSKQEPSHMDYWNYYNILLQLLKETPTVTEPKTKSLVPLFLDFVQHEFGASADDEEDEEEKDEATSLHLLQRSSKIVKSKMSSWLDVFSVFVNPKSAYRSQELFDIFMRLVSMGDSKLQPQALECVFTWKDSHVKPYADNLRNLMDDVKFRDELSTFVQNEEQIMIDPAHRKGLMPLVMRILFGRIVQRSKSSSKSSKNSRRKVILSAVACCQVPEIRYFIDLALEPFASIIELPGVETDKNGNVTKMEFKEEGNKLLEAIPWRKQSGLLNLMEDMIKQMATHILPFLPDLLKAVLYIINFIHARHSDDMEIDQPEHSNQSNKSKEIKALALKRIVEMFRINGNFNFTPFVPAMFTSFISDRLETLPKESSQDLSTLTQLFLVWSKKETYAHYFIDFDTRVLPQIIATLAVKKLNEHVLNALLEIIESLLDLCDSQMEVDGAVSLKDKLIVPHVDLLLNDLKFRLTLSKDDVKFGTGRYSVREIAIAARIAEFTTDGEQAASIIEILLPSLKRPSKSIPERSKQDIMVIWSKFIRIVPGFEADSTLYHQYYIMASSMFATAYSRESRTSLVQVFHAFADVNPELAKVDELLTMLNSYSPKRIDEPDYDKMLEALSLIGEEYYQQFTIHQWLPILHQLIHNMRDVEEMAIRGTATHCMIQFLKATKEQSDQEIKHKMIGYINHVIYPAIKKGLRSRVELIRIEFVTVLNSCIKLFPELPMFEDLVPLLGDDEEANFFYNIYHMQIHRRSRALTRLSEYAPKGTLNPASINNIFVPIISAFFNEGERTVDHNLLHQCTITLSSLASVLPWTPYYRLLQTYLELVNKMEEKERLYVRVVIGLLDAFHFDLKDIKLSDETVKSIMGRQKIRIDYLTDEEIKKQAAVDAGQVVEEPKDQVDEQVVEPEEVDPEQKEREKAEKIHEVLVTKIMPDLNQLLNNNKSRRSVIVRVPLALGIAKLVRHLPEKSMRLNLPGLLTSVCHIIRSRAQDVRDITRETLIKINAFLGPSYFKFIMKELRGALKKGYELHVLGYTLNSLLLDMMPRLNVGDLDYCIRDVIELLVNDVFGATGQEKDADEMTGKTKEAKSRRSPQSFELLAKVVHFKSVGLMLSPLKDVMSETESNRILRKVDDILRRISHGLVHNPEFESIELLDFSYGLISQNLQEFKVEQKKKKVKTQEEMNYEVQVKRPMTEAIDYYRANAHRFVYFGLSLFATGLKRTKYDLSDKEINQKFSGLINVVGNTLYTSQSANIVLAARIMCSLLLLPISGVQSAIDVSIKRVFQLLQGSGTSNNTTAQACLRLLTVCVRDSNKSKLTEKQLTFILDFVRPDLEELERHGTIFALLRAIISRKFMAPELYEMMDTIASVFVTNQSKEIREQARSVYFTFLMDYPQGQGRLKKQMSFLTKNLEYVFETGRESVMELLHHVISKFGEDILSEFYDTIFFALVMRLVNDESAKCREMAAALIKTLLSRIPDKLPTIYRLLNKWLTQSNKSTLQRAACQVFGLAIDTFGVQVRPQVPELIQSLSEILQHSKSIAEELSNETADNEEDDMEVEVPWEVTYYAINVFAKITKTFPKSVYDTETESVWRVMEYMLLYPHAWIRSSSTRLYGVYFSGIDPETRQVKESEADCDYLDKETLRRLATDFLEQLKSQHVTQEQADQIVKNLFFIGKCFYYMSDDEDTHDNEEEIKIDDAKDEIIEDEKNDKEATKAQEQINKRAHKRSLNWLFRRASFDARGAAIRKTKNGILHRSSIYKWFAAMCNTLDTEELPPYLMPVVAPIYRTVNDEQNKAAGFDALQQLGNEVLNLLQAKAGPTIYFAVYQRVRQQVTKTREERKTKEAILAITNPTLAAKRKLDKNQRSKNAKKKRF